MGSRARKLNGGWENATPLAESVKRSTFACAAGFRSTTPRFQPPRCDRELQYRLSGMGFIDPDVGHKATLATSVARSRQRLSYAFRSRKQRFASHSHEDGPGPTRAAEEHGSIFARIRASKLTYTGMTDKASPRFSERPASHEAYKQTLGPGAYGVPHDEAVRPRTAGVPPSKSPRFKEARDPFKYIGSTYTHARDTRAWTASGFYAPRTQRKPVGDSHLNDLSHNVDALGKATVATTARRNPQRYSNAFRSTVSRGVSPRALRFNVTGQTIVPDTAPEDGPGRYDPPQLRPNMDTVGVSVREPRRPDSSFVSASPRIPDHDRRERGLRDTLRNLDTTHHRHTLRDDVQRSPRRYAALRSPSPRF